MEREKVTVFVFTLNEEINLPACLDSLKWTDEIVVVDSYSDDQTVKICEERDVKVYQHRFAGFGSQRNWALDNISMKYSWVLILDADERVPAELAKEIIYQVNNRDSDIVAYRIKRKFYLWGKWLKHSSLYPTWVVRLIRNDKVRYINRGHAETQEVQGKIGSLKNDLIDENFKSIDAWFERQNLYTSREALHELEKQNTKIRYFDVVSNDPTIRRAAIKQLTWNLPGRAFWYFLYSYLWRLGMLDGKEGFMYCIMRSIHQGMIEIKKYDILKRDH